MRLGKPADPARVEEYADGAYFELGSALRLFSLEEKKENELTVLSQTDAFRSMEHCDLKELVVFGCNGVAVTADQIVHLAKQLHA